MSLLSPGYQSTPLRRAMLLFTSALLTLLIVGYGLLYFQLRQIQLHDAEVLLNNVVEEVNHKIDNQEMDFNEIVKQQSSVLATYDFMIFSPTGNSIILTNAPMNAGFSLPTWQMTAENKNILQRKSNSIEVWYELHNQYQMYAKIRTTPWLTWFSYFIHPVYFLPILVFFLLFMGFLFIMHQRQLMWRRLIDYSQNIQTSRMTGYQPLAINPNVFDTDAAQIGQALNRLGYQVSQYSQIIHDLTHRQQMLVDNAPVPLFLLNRKGEMTYFNQNFAAVFITPFRPDSLYMLTDFVAGSDKLTQRKLLTLSDNLSATTLSVTDIQLSQHFDLRLNPLYARFGQLLGYSGVLEQVGSYHSQLQQARLTDRQQQDKLASFDKLWAVLGHELRTPLSGIIGMIDLLSEEKDNLTPEQIETLTTLQQSGSTMLQLLNDMLDMAKLDAGKLQLNLANTDILKLSRQVCDLMSGNARRQHIDLLYHATPTIPRLILTDDGRLRQIMLNLLSNAIKFTKQGYVALLLDSVLATDAIIQKKAIQTTPTNHWLKITVKDTGIGISPKEQQKLFSFFNQANESISRQFGGTGLGLAISNSFAQMMGGFIHLHSEVGVGSEFQVYLPLENYHSQSAFQFNTDNYHVQMVIFVKYELSVGYVKAIFDSLNISAIVNCGIDDEIIGSINQILDPKLMPLFLIDDLCYIGYEAEFEKITNFATSKKILSSMETERSFDPFILTEFDGFLQKPVNMSSFMAEMARLYDDNSAKNLSDTMTAQMSYALFLQRLANEQKPISSLLSQDKIIHTTLEKTVEIPIENTAELSDSSPQSADPTPVIAISQKTILVAEDNIVNQKIATKHLEKMGYQVIIVENGLKAIEALASNRNNIAVVLMDCQMPVLDGIEATRRIRDNQDSIPIIALTANESEEYKEQCLRAGMDGFLTKPLNKDKLAEQLKRFMV